MFIKQLFAQQEASKIIERSSYVDKSLCHIAGADGNNNTGFIITSGR